MICMIPKVNLGVGEMGFMFCDSHVPLTFVGGDEFDELALFDFGFDRRHIRFSNSSIPSMLIWSNTLVPLKK